MPELISGVVSWSGVRDFCSTMAVTSGLVGGEAEDAAVAGGVGGDGGEDGHRGVFAEVECRGWRRWSRAG